MRAGFIECLCGMFRGQGGGSCPQRPWGQSPVPMPKGGCTCLKDERRRRDLMAHKIVGAVAALALLGGCAYDIEDMREKKKKGTKNGEKIKKQKKSNEIGQT
eukprot:TRINITY_DN88261_c0_g1_i1.p2 TRINITY_DN88261_c0_g1~~TRINITY_DN88261_c0_g1_i1.p2  ORF type:complete len:102 (-),score=9.30 TRINITY_DN88261_c0_g1_i1:72-377(-)